MLSGMQLTPGVGVDFGAIGVTLVTLAGIYLLSSLFGWVQQYMTAGMVQRTIYRLREAVDLKLARLPLRYFDSHPRGDLLSRLPNDLDNIPNTPMQTPAHPIGQGFGRRQAAIERFDRENGLLYQASFKAQFISGIIHPAMMFVSNLNYVAVAVIGGLGGGQGTLSLGGVPAFVQYSRQL